MPRELSAPLLGLLAESLAEKLDQIDPLQEWMDAPAGR
jgi:hypothetical protein